VVVPEDQLSLAIGRDGQNARLAAKLTGWRIDIKSLVEAAGDAIVKVREDPEYAEMAEREAESIDKVAVMLEKKAEGRPLPPEDYDFMGGLVDRVEKRVEKKRREEDLEEKRRYEEALATVPELTFDIDILDVDLKEHILFIIQEAGIETLGALVLQMRLDPDKILALNGIGPKSFEEIEALTDGLRVTPEEAAAKVAAETEAAAAPEEQAEIEDVDVEVPAAEDLDDAVEDIASEDIAEPVVEAEEPAVAETAKPESAKADPEKEEEKDEFDKLFSYDARKYGYYAPETPKFDDEKAEEPAKPAKKKKTKKRRQNLDDKDEWEEWS